MKHNRCSIGTDGDLAQEESSAVFRLMKEEPARGSFAVDKEIKGPSRGRRGDEILLRTPVGGVDVCAGDNPFRQKVRASLRETR